MTSTEEAHPRLADELAQAEQAAAGPRQQLAALENALQTAIAGGQFDQAAAIQADLETAREAHAVADSRVTALRSAAAKLERDRVTAAQKIGQAQQAEEANRDLVTAQGDAAQATSQMNAALAAMREAFASARQHLRTARAFQDQITAARARELQAKGRLGYWPPDHPGPALSRANAVTVLEESDPLVRALTRALP